MRDSNLCKIRIGAEKHGLAIQPRDHLAVAAQPYFDHRKPIRKNVPRGTRTRTLIRVISQSSQQQTAVKRLTRYPPKSKPSANQ
ncbi:MAG: hypothetical protein WBW69_10270, partial [Candidatus Korobacteraceae bacterium]